MGSVKISAVSVRQEGPFGAPVPRGADVLELVRPLTWFPPMWAYLCGAVSAGVVWSDRWLPVLVGMALAGPLVCAASQAANDWFDRDVDALNEPGRPIPSGRVGGLWGLAVAVLLSAVSLPIGWVLGPWVFAATLVGLGLAWAYSAPPLRLKRDGWIGPVACALAYEGLPWFAAAAAALGALPPATVTAAALLYAFGAVGIMTLNDFKALDGDRAHGLRSLPVRYGSDAAARIACAFMIVGQLGIVILLAVIDARLAAALVALIVLAQLPCMARLLAAPRERAPWFNAVGTGLFVGGMMVTAIALGMPA